VHGTEGSPSSYGTFHLWHVFFTRQTLPSLGAATYRFLLRELTDGHGSTTAFVRQLQYALLRHFSTCPLAFLCVSS